MLLLLILFRISFNPLVGPDAVSPQVGKVVQVRFISVRGDIVADVDDLGCRSSQTLLAFY